MTTHNDDNTNRITPHDAVFVQPPPADANIPSPPPGFTAVPGGFARALKPKAAELVSLPGAISEVQAFADYAATLGRTVPSQPDVLQTFSAAQQWSQMRAKARDWDKYSANEEGVAWTAVRAMMERMKPSFEAAVKGDPTLATKYPKLYALLGAKSSIAAKAVSTKRANRKAKAEGKPEFHGLVGKKRLRAEQKAALEALKQPPVAAAQPHVEAPQPAADPQPAPAVTNGASNGASNGAANGMAHA